MNPYRIIASATLAAMTESVNSAIREGYEPYGQLFLYDGNICQAVRLPPREEADHPMTDITTWQGVPLDKLSRAELLEALEWCAAEIARLEADRNRWRTAGDPVKYLLSAPQRS